MSLKVTRRKYGLNEMIDVVCEWYGIDREEFKSLGVLAMYWMEGDYTGTLFAFSEWKEKYYRDNRCEGGRR